MLGNGDYGGDVNYDSADGSRAFAVDKANSTTTIANCPSGPVTAGQPQSFQITVKWSTNPTATGAEQPTGQVILYASPYSGSSTHASGTLSPALGGLLPYTVTIPITLTAKGQYTVTAAYQGDGNYNTSTSGQCVATAN
jgi:Bacterial Ig-like domain (group 3)